MNLGSSPKRASEPPARDAWLLAAIALLLRLGFVVWAASRFLPAEDGKYYQIVAWRIARGLGYTWLWPDGVVTYAAHYPVGYPAILGGLYWLFGPRPWLAMALNALLGSLAVAGVVRLASSVATRRGAIIAGCIAAVHPTLLFYTPALMTEIVSASILAIGAWMALAAGQASRGRKLVADRRAWDADGHCHVGATSANRICARARVAGVRRRQGHFADALAPATRRRLCDDGIGHFMLFALDFS